MPSTYIPLSLRWASIYTWLQCILCHATSPPLLPSSSLVASWRRSTTPALMSASHFSTMSRTTTSTTLSQTRIMHSILCCGIMCLARMRPIQSPQTSKLPAKKASKRVRNFGKGMLRYALSLCAMCTLKRVPHPMHGIQRCEFCACIPGKRLDTWVKSISRSTLVLSASLILQCIPCEIFNGSNRKG